jgi:DNA-binding response OmpR family regulator
VSLELIQIIEEREQAREIDQLLRKASFRTNVACDGPTGVDDIRRLKPALVVLDLLPPGLSGKEISAGLRADPETSSMGIIVMGATASEDQRVGVLNAGADDVIAKPYAGRELVARVKAVLRRVAATPPMGDGKTGGELVLEDTQFVVTFRGARLVLTKAEWTVLARLARTSGHVVPREELRAALWGEDALFHDRALDEAIHSLAAKLSGHARGLITGIPGTGFRLAVTSSPLPLSA